MPFYNCKYQHLFKNREIYINNSSDKWPSNNFCVLPWMGLVVEPNGDLLVCCQFDKEIYRGLNLDRDNQLWEKLREQFLNGVWPDPCKICKEKEQLGIKSRRQSYCNKFGWLKEYDFAKEKLPLIFLDYNNDNRCNLSCIMCSSYLACKIANREQQLNNRHEGKLYREFLAKRQITVFGPMDNGNIHKKILNTDVFFNRYGELILKGGEPFLANSNYELLQNLIKNKYAPNMALFISTNGTIDIGKWIPLLKKFFKVEINISLDATGELWEYIRGGCKKDFSNIEKNIHMAKKENIPLSISPTVQICNIFNLTDIQEYANKFNIPIDYDLVLDRPAYLSISNMPDDLKQLARDSLKELVKICNNEREFSSIKNIEDALNIPYGENSKKIFEAGLDFISWYDKQSNLKLKELNPIWDRCY